MLSGASVALPGPTPPWTGNGQPLSLRRWNPLPPSHPPPLMPVLAALIAATATAAAPPPPGAAAGRRGVGAPASCSLDGHWYYCPEGVAHDYHWNVTAGGKLQCFHGLDGWVEASGQLRGNNLSLHFGDPACTGAGALNVQKWGLVNDDCSLVVMHDVQGNCPKQGSCAYARIGVGHCPGNPRPPPPPPAPLPPPCPTSSAEIDVEWLSCRTEQIIKGCVEKILPTSVLNRGINGTAPTSVSFHPMLS